MFISNLTPDDVAQKAMPSLGLPRVTWYARTNATGTTYFVQFTESGRDPYRKSIRLHSSVPAAAQREARMLGERYHNGLYDPWNLAPTDTFLKDAYIEWMESGKQWSPQTVRGRQGVMKLFLRGHPRSRVDAITAADIETFISRPNLKPVSRVSYLRVLNTFFRWCTSQRIIAEAPTKHVKAPKSRRRKIAYFTLDELDRFCEAARQYYDRRRKVIDKAGRGNFIWIVPLVRFAVATGLRKGELIHLRWCDVDLENTFLHVRSYRAHWQGRDVVFQTKVGSDRMVPLYEMALDVLSHQLARRRSESADEPVFLGPSGRHLGASQVNRAFRLAREKASLPNDLNIHACRHTFASWLLSAGESPFLVSRHLGHTKMSTTTDIYGHLIKSGGDIGDKVFGSRIAI